MTRVFIVFRTCVEVLKNKWCVYQGEKGRHTLVVDNEEGKGKNDTFLRFLYSPDVYYRAEERCLV